jgi:hypothetical protein
MNPEEKQLLQETAELTKENNKILKSMRRSARLSAFLRFVYWAVILGGAVASYYFIQPYLNAVVNGYSEIQKGISDVKGVSDKLPDLSSWFGGKQ